MTTEFGFDKASDFQIEGAPLHTHGNLLVMVDPIGDATPQSLGVDITARAKNSDADRVLVFSNNRLTPAQFGQWFGEGFGTWVCDVSHKISAV